MGHARTPKTSGIVYTNGVEQCGNIRASEVCCQVKAKGEKTLFCTIDNIVIFYI